MASSVISAHDGKTRFYISDILTAEHVYNAARNIEAAAWLLATRQSVAGAPLLWANEMSVTATNLSFEREFGALIGRLDLVANLLDENFRRVDRQGVVSGKGVSVRVDLGCRGVLN